MTSSFPWTESRRNQGRNQGESLPVPITRKVKRNHTHALFSMVREGPARTPPPHKEPYPTERARGGEIILRTSARRAIFLTGLLGAVVLAVLILVIAH